ncbi:MAG: outer membrane lipoprotein carrier protein LolA [Candidatus Lindowbacteria bacterium]|nr:outer membrane lipoprotein carrier protein LolA [Candidatus Lindowbacteria bacterium]
MKTLRKALTVAFVLVFASVALAQTDAKTQQMMDEVTQKVKAVNSYRVDVKMETSMEGQKMVTSGTMAFKMPDKMHMVTTTAMPSMPNMPPGMSNMKQDTYSTGDTLWTYMPAMNMARKVDMAKVKKQFPQAPTGKTEDPTKPFEAFLKNKIKFVEKKTVDGQPVYVFEGDIAELSAQMSGGQMGPQDTPSKMAVWINSETGLPNKMLIYAKNNALMMTHIYSNYKINVPINESEFQFKPPAGVQVMDDTQMVMDSMKKMQTPLKSK